MSTTIDIASYFSRQRQMPELGEGALEKLQAASVLVVGAGGLGCPALQYLAAAGVGNLIVVDVDTVEVSNLHRQLLFAPNDVGRSKATVAAEKIQEQFPFTRITAYNETFTADLGTQLLPQVDLVLDCTDQVHVKYLLDDFCLCLGKPWIFAAISGFEMQWGLCTADGLRYASIFPVPPNPMHMRTCEQNGTIGVVPGMAALFQVNLAIQFLTQQANIGCGMHYFDAMQGRKTFLEVQQNTEVIVPDLDTILSKDYQKYILDFHYKKEQHG